jgi:hypothetical protein
MDRPTFDALKRILERTRPGNFDPKQIRNDWLQVVGWMQEADKISTTFRRSAPTTLAASYARCSSRAGHTISCLVASSLS